MKSSNDYILDDFDDLLINEFEIDTFNAQK